MPIPESFIQQIKDRNDIVDVVSSYVRLTKKSGPNHSGLCPFHSEKTPSFNVNTDKQIYHCFGCGEGGGVINFIMKIENVSFRDAVEMLADRAGLKVPEEEDPEMNLRKRLLALNKQAAKFYYERLISPGGERCRSYLSERGISSKTAARFGLGYAPDGWRELYDAMRAKGFTDHELFTAQLVRKREKGGYYDVFRNRLMFPVFNVRGDVIGFSGRDIGSAVPDPKGYTPAKYMNSPETPVFVKGSNLFALNFAKNSKEPNFILVEGNIDVVSLHQAGFDNAIASLGTALTAEQARLISNYKQELIIAYDNDSAGAKATQKAIAIFEKLNVKVRVLRLSGAKDPDEYIKRFGSAGFRNLIEAAPGDLDFRLEQIKAKYNLADPAQKVSFAKEAASVISESNDMIKRSVYAGIIAAEAGLPEKVVADETERQHRSKLKAAEKTESREGTKPLNQMPTGSKKVFFENPASAAAEAALIRLLLADPSVADRRDLPEASEFSCDFYRRIYSVVLSRLRDGLGTSPDYLSSELDSDEISAVVELSRAPTVLSDVDAQARDIISRIHSQNVKPQSLLELQQSLQGTKKYHRDSEKR